MRRPSPRAMKRMLKKMGMDMAPVEGVKEVIIRFPGKTLIMESPEVFMIEVGGQRVYQVVPGAIKEEAMARRPVIPEEDVLLVARQTGVSLEEARAALEESGGDLAKAVLLLTERG